MADMTKVTGLWKHAGKNGTYYSGPLGLAQVLIFSNKFKRSEKDPDLTMCIAPKAEKAAEAKDAEPEKDDDGSIPF